MNGDWFPVHYLKPPGNRLFVLVLINITRCPLSKRYKVSRPHNNCTNGIGFFAGVHTVRPALSLAVFAFCLFEEHY